MKVAIEISNPHLAATDAATPIEHLYWLVFHDDKHIRTKVAENPKLPAAGLAALADDESHEVRIAVSEHPRTPNSVLQQLAVDEHPDVRYALAENANVPEHILNILSGDENPYVADRASKTLQRVSKQAPTLVLLCA